MFGVRTHGLSDGLIDVWIDGRMHAQSGGQMHVQTNRWADEVIDEWADSQTHRRRPVWMARDSPAHRCAVHHSMR